MRLEEGLLLLYVLRALSRPLQPQEKVERVLRLLAACEDLTVTRLRVHHINGIRLSWPH